MAQYALGDDGNGDEEIVAPIEERVGALLSALEETEAHLLSLGFEIGRLLGATGFTKIAAIDAGVEAVYTSDETKRRFEILCRQVFIRFKALVMEPSAYAYAERHDNLEAIYKKLEERRDTADVTALLKELHRIVNEAIRAYGRYSEIIADYNRETDRVTVEDTFARLVDLANNLDAEQRRATEEGLSEEELALFDLLKRPDLTKADRERVKQASRGLLASIQALIAPLERWTDKETTQAEVEVFILDRVFESLPTPPFSDEDKERVAKSVYLHIWQQGMNPQGPLAA